MSRRPLKKLPDLVAEKLAQRDAGDHRPVLLFTQDEARFGRISISDFVNSIWPLLILSFGPTPQRLLYNQVS